MKDNLDNKEFLLEKLKQQYTKEIIENIIKGMEQERVVTLRVNTLKSNIDKICKELELNNIVSERVNIIDDALVIKNVNEQAIKKLNIYERGEIYLQSLSSMLPPIILNPKEGEDILDMTAAPGGKTTQIAAITNNKANITACEMNSIREERLRYNINKQGANSVSIIKADSRKLSDYFAFDKILLDAPCSGSGTINLNDERTYKNFNENLIRKITVSQSELLKKSLKILKPEHEMVYSTCSILQEENEDIVNKAIRGMNVEIIPICINGIENIPKLPCKIEGALCVAPNKYYEGFFVVKIRKNK